MTGDSLDLDNRFVWHPYTQEAVAPPPIEMVSGEGAYLVSADGTRYLDLVSSWWVNLHGHAHPAIAAAITHQARTLEQVIFANFTHAPAAQLAARLAAILPRGLSRTFYSDDGSTAVEVALKIALQYFVNQGQGARKRIVAFDGGYHGDTVGAMSVGRSSGYFRAWDGLLFPVAMTPFPETWIGDDEVAEKEDAALDRLDELLGPDVAAVIVEPLIQGAGGMRMCRPEFLRKLAERVRASGALLVFDEVMTGFGRTGTLFACTGANVAPDLICLSKGLTGGFLPMGATIVQEDIHQAFLGEGLDLAFLHGHSYTANPLGCAAGLASLDLLERADCAQRRARIEAIHRARIGSVKGTRPRVTGTVAAIDLGPRDYASGIGAELKAHFMAHGMVLRPLGSVAYFLPPYCVAEADLHRAYDLLEHWARQSPGDGGGNAERVP